MSLNALFSLLAFRRRPVSDPLKDLRTMQDAYDHIRQHFLTQKVRARPSIKDVARCQYRTKDGLTCAVGCLVSPDNYDPAMEGSNIFNDRVIRAVETSTSLKLRTDMIDFLFQAQMIHDSTRDLNFEGVTKLDQLAEVWNLNVPSL